MDFMYENVISYFDQISKALNQLYPNLTGLNAKDKAPVIPVTGNDIFNYIARYGAANYQIQTVMKLDDKLDKTKLLKAIKLSIETEPVFGCHFVEKHPPYWKLADNMDNIQFCTFEETNDADEAVKRFLEGPLHMDKDPMIKMKLITCNNKDTLCLKINHTCCDGAGVKEYIKLLTDIYTSLDQGNDYIPTPHRQSKKDQDRLFNSLGIKNPLALLNPLSEIPTTMWVFPWLHGDMGPARIAVYKLPKGHIDIMYEYGKSKGATVNDLILTAIYRTMFEISQPPYGIPMDIPLTIDLRRYLPEQKTEAIRNFSGGTFTKLARVANEPFDGTLSRVAKITNKLKHGHPGLQSAIGIKKVEDENIHTILSFYRNVSNFVLQCSKLFCHCSPVVSNLGFIDKSLMKFGEVTVTDAYVIPPAVSAPGILLCLGTYNGDLTIAISYFEGQTNRESIERLLNLICKELIDGCKI